MKILLVGDSFAADWSSLHPGCQGWPNLLAKQYQITNCAQAGVSEYKIWLQLQSQDLCRFSHVIIGHTSPYRIPVDRHPLHGQDPLHHACDLMYEDIRSRDLKEFAGLVDYFENWFDLDYARFVQQLIIHKQCEHVIAKNSKLRVLHTNPLGLNIDTQSQACLDLYQVFLKHRGYINHFDDQGNEMVTKKIISWIQKTEPFGSLDRA